MTHTIKRYSNRKLYDTERSKYVTLSEVAEMVRAGSDVRVVDFESERDLTSAILAQVLFEEERAAPRLPVAGLARLIRDGAAALAGT